MRESAGHLRAIGGTVAPSRAARSPVRDSAVDDAEIEGPWPPGLAGTFLHTGPHGALDPVWPATLVPPAATVHAVQVAGGRARCRARTLEAPAPERGFGAPAAGVVRHAGRILVVGELGPPWRLDPDLAVLGVEDFGGALADGTGPRPRRDPVWEDLCCLRWSPEPPYAAVTVLDATGRRRRATPLGLDGPTHLGDLGITDQHLLVFDHPVRVEVTPAGGLEPRWHPGVGTRIGVVDRESDTAPVRWFPVETREVVRVVNAWRSGERVVVDTLCRRCPPWAVGDGPDGRPLLVRTTVDLAAGGAHDELLDVVGWAAVSIDERRTGLRSRFCFAVHPGDGEGLPAALVRFDAADQRIDEHRFGPGMQAGEPQFVPAGPDAAEGDGWLLVPVSGADGAEVQVFAADRVADGPRATVRLPQPVPPGGGGTWVPAVPA
jgi:carotenoid cleavage dioxygenase